ncbi:outer membrane beta-barrel protein [Pontiellaceae bacterium B1224]|nr:outer membrane beta-barrel protein [Pontiellaceae bacterium B1224]
MLRPRVDVLGAYDSRVEIDDATGDSEGDCYGEASVGISVKNLPALFAFSADASYGRRDYVDLTENDGDFYNAGASIRSEGETGLRWQLAGETAKTLSYDTAYDPETGEGPPAILTDQTSTRWTAAGNVGYAIPLSDTTFLVPEYSMTYYYEEFESGDPADWQTHDVSLMMNYVLSERITLLAGGFYTLQTNSEEDGSIVTVGGGAQGKLSDKTSWTILGGMAYADYEVSGTGKGGIVDLRVNWQATDKLSAYVFYGNGYEPGYDGDGARMAYRGGYGAGWALAERWSLGGEVLHDYSDEINSGSAPDPYGGVSHFFSTQLTYNPTRHLSTSLRGQYVNDEEPEDQQIVSLSVSYVF